MDGKPLSFAVSIMVAMIKEAWCRETASPGCQDGWSEDNPSWGQCAITALAVQNLVGGDLMRTVVEGHGSHYYNRLLDGTEIDLTRDQFPEGTEVPPGKVADRQAVLFSERAQSAQTRERYELLLWRISQS